MVRGALPLLDSPSLFTQHLFSEESGFVGPFPGEVKVSPTKVPKTGGRPIDGSAQVKIPNNRSRSQVKVFLNQAKQDFLVNLGGAKGLNRDR